MKIYRIAPVTNKCLFIYFVYKSVIGEIPRLRHDVGAVCVWNPASSSPAPQSLERRTLSGRESRGRSSFLPGAPSARPFCMVDIIFSSSFLGDMGDHSKSKSSKLLGDRCLFCGSGCTDGDVILK